MAVARGWRQVARWSCKADPRVEAYGGVDETNACVGLVRLHTVDDAVLDPMLARIQNDLFDLGADLATPIGPSRPGRGGDAGPGALRIIQAQVDRLEARDRPAQREARAPDLTASSCPAVRRPRPRFASGARTVLPGGPSARWCCWRPTPRARSSASRP